MPRRELSRPEQVISWLESWGRVLSKPGEMILIGFFLVPDDWGRLEYGRMLWKNPECRERLLRHWCDSRHPYSGRFQERYRKWVIMLLESDPGDDQTLDQELRRQGHSLRAIMREIPPVFGSFY